MYEEIVETDEGTGLVAYITPDEWVPDSPRDWDNVGSMCLFHGRYDFPNELGAEPRTPTKEELEGWGVLWIGTVYLLDHSGITVRLGSGGNPFSGVDPGGWDSGAVGFIAITKDRWDAIMGEPFTEERAREVAEGEVKNYAMYLEGDVWVAGVRNAEDEVLDSVAGCYGYSFAEQEAEAMLAHAIKEAKLEDERRLEWAKRDVVTK